MTRMVGQLFDMRLSAGQGEFGFTSFGSAPTVDHFPSDLRMKLNTKYMVTKRECLPVKGIISRQVNRIRGYLESL